MRRTPVVRLRVLSIRFCTALRRPFVQPATAMGCEGTMDTKCCRCGILVQADPDDGRRGEKRPRGADAPLWDIRAP